MMRSDSAVSSVVGVVLLLLLVVLAASVIGLTLSTATQNAVESTPNVQFIPSENPRMLYHGGGDILYKNRLTFYDNGVDITDTVSIDSVTTWTDWRTGQAIELPDDYYVANLTIIAVDTLGRDQLLYRGSGAIVTPVPTGTPGPSPYYTAGSDHADGFATVQELVESLNEWSNALYGEDVALTYGGNQIGFKGNVPIGHEPIRITGGMGTVTLTTYTGTLTEVSFTRAPGYEGELLVIHSGAKLKTGGATLKLDGMGHGAAPLLVITPGGSLDFNEVITLVNNTNPTGNGGAIRNEGSLDVYTKMTIYNNTARNGGGVYNVGTYFEIKACDIHDNVALENGGGFYNAGSSLVDINNQDIKVYNNRAKDGGGVYNTGSIAGGFPITGNTASGKGGGIYNTGSLDFQGGSQSVIDNSATYGGGIYNDIGGTITSNSPPISSNTASISGGGVYNKGTYTFSGAPTVTNNNAQSGSGGGIYNEGSIPSFVGTISGNTASIFGGGVYNKGTSTFGWTSTVTNNNAQYGGGVYNTGTVPTFGGSISGNTATIQGGGLYNTNSFTLAGGSSITGNTAPQNPNRYG